MSYIPLHQLICQFKRSDPFFTKQYRYLGRPVPVRFDWAACWQIPVDCRSSKSYPVPVAKACFRVFAAGRQLYVRQAFLAPAIVAWSVARHPVCRRPQTIEHQQSRHCLLIQRPFVASFLSPAFFFRTNRAAVSASALSLRLSSALSCLFSCAWRRTLA